MGVGGFVELVNLAVVAERSISSAAVEAGRWTHPKPIWCVRLSPDAQLLAAAGYDCKLTLYDTVSRAVLQQVALPI